MTSSPIEPGQVRIGDAERQVAAETLARAHALGQLEVDEFHDRVEQTHASRVRADLDSLLRDLPDPAADGAPSAKKPAGSLLTRGGATSWSSPLTRDHAKAAGAMLATVPRKVWVVVAALIMSLIVAGIFFDGEHDHHEVRGGPMGAGGDGVRDGAEHMWQGGGFAFGVLMTLLVLFVVRRVRARKSATRAS